MSLFLAGSLIAATVKSLADINTSMKLDEKAQKKYAQAYERQTQAEQLIAEKRTQADHSLMKVANRKRAILSTSMQNFLTLYRRILSIDFQAGDGILELEKGPFSAGNIARIEHMAATAIKPMTDKELFKTYLFKGLGGMAIAESKRNLSMANSQAKISEVVYSQAETVAVVLDGISTRGEQLAQLLAKLNFLFIQSIACSTELINQNGTSRAAYSRDAREKLMVCINLADALKKMIDTPLLDHEGQLAQESLHALEVGAEYLQKLEQI